MPFKRAAERYAAGEFRWFDPPTKIIAPFPSLTEVCYTELLHAPPMPGMIDQYYDVRAKRIQNGMWLRMARGQYPWERSLHYRANYTDEGFAYLHTTPGSTVDTTLFQDIGQVRVGRLVSVVVVRLDEIDYNYEPSDTPAVRSLPAAAALLG